MNTFENLRRSAGEARLFLRQAWSYMAAFLWSLLLPKASLAVRLLAAESQLTAYRLRIDQQQGPKPRFTPAFRLLWVILSKLWARWERAAQLMQPATVKPSHDTAFRFYWRWKSRAQQGRPPISKDLVTLIRQLNRENSLWSPERIRDTLQLLGYDAPCADTIRKYMVTARNPGGRSTTWLAFLRNHLGVSWAIDFCTVATVNFGCLYVFLVLDHGRRKVIHFGSSYHPTLAWVVQQLRETTPFGQKPRYLFRDNDQIYGAGVKEFLDRSGIEEVWIVYRSPWQRELVSYCT